jgi:hypothetical protein
VWLFLTLVSSFLQNLLELISDSSLGTALAWAPCLWLLDRHSDPLLSFITLYIELSSCLASTYSKTTTNSKPRASLLRKAEDLGITAKSWLSCFLFSYSYLMFWTEVQHQILHSLLWSSWKKVSKPSKMFWRNGFTLFRKELELHRAKQLLWGLLDGWNPDFLKGWDLGGVWEAFKLSPFRFLQTVHKGQTSRIK